MPVVLLVALTLSADPTAAQVELLKTFRSEFVSIAPGMENFPRVFNMGRETGESTSIPPHTVSIGYPFHIAKYEVPQNLWQAVMGINPSQWKGPRNSVEMLSLDDARKFCQKSTEMMRAAKLILPDEVVRLPSESEWEYCARAGTATVYSFGDDAEQLGQYAWFTDNAKGNDPPVGAKKPNAWGLYDVHGYLWEWCEDAWHPSYQGAPTDGSARRDEQPSAAGIVRGGSWKDKAENLTSTFRRKVPVDFRDDAVGLRCVLAKAK